jgi:hypothetical protein
MLESVLAVLREKRPLDMTNHETVTLTPSEVKAVQGVLGAKAQAVVSTLREAGMIGFRERVRGQKKQVF